MANYEAEKPHTFTLTLTERERVALADALNNINGHVPMIAWDDWRRDSAEAILRRLPSNGALRFSHEFGR